MHTCTRVDKLHGERGQECRGSAAGNDQKSVTVGQTRAIGGAHMKEILFFYFLYIYFFLEVVLR